MDGSRPRVIVTRRLPGGALDRLAEHAVVERPADDAAMPRAELLGRLPGALGLISLLCDTVDAALLDVGRDLRVVANYAVGVDNVDLAAARERKVVVANTPGVLTDATADLTMALMLATARRLVEGESLARSGAWRGWAPDLLLGVGLGGRRLGIIGLGRIGQAVARRAAGFGMEVVYYSHHRLPSSREARLGVRYAELDDLLATSDVISLHLPLNGDTRGFLDAARMRAMKQGALVINTARGELVDAAALADAIREGHLGGAGLDVYADEPAVPPVLLALGPRVTLLPHLGSATREAREGMADLAVDAVLEVLAGRRPRNAVPGGG